MSRKLQQVAVPTRLIGPPRRIVVNGVTVVVLDTDVGTMPVQQVADLVGLNKNTIFTRLRSHNIGWRSEYILAKATKKGFRITGGVITTSGEGHGTKEWQDLCKRSAKTARARAANLDKIRKPGYWELHRER